jgi:diguanylate cyclase (GGDEF)-like protein
MMLQKRKNGWVIIFIVAVLMLGFIITSLLSYMVTKKYVVGSTVEQTLPLISDNIYSEIKKDLLDPINVSSLMANDEFLVNWVLSGEEDVNQITNYLSRIKNSYGYTSVFFVSEKTHNYYYYDGILKQISKDDAHDVWYFDFKEMGRPVDLDVDSDEASQGTLTVFINHRLESKDGKFLGVTGIGLELRNIGEKLADYQEEYGHNVYLVDKIGMIQIHCDPNLVENVNILEQDGINDLNGQILSPNDEIQIYEYKDNEGSKAISIRYIPEFDWYLVVEKNHDSSLIQAKRSLWQNILIGLMVTLVVSIVMIVIFKANNRRIEQLASMDELTYLYNRRYFIQLLDREISISKRYSQVLSLLMLDVDDFKSVNDEYGHFIGDDMLRLIANTIKLSVRDSDIVGRWGGEEFVVLLLNTTTQEASIIAERIVKAVAESALETRDGALYRTISIGIACFDAKTMTRETLLHNADEALFRAKEHGKNTIA